jgi:flavin reductase (DIM6/NTAB) family NADH-FMN oxidoreductase RutF
MPPRKRRAPPSDDNNSKDKDKNAEQSPPAKQTKSTTRSSTKTSSLSPYPVDKVFRLIEPGPVLLVTTGSLKDNTHNIMTIGFHMMMQHDSPALIGVIIGPWDASFALLKKHRECVLAVPSVEMAATTVDIGNCSGSEVNKFEKFDLEVVPAEKVQAPLVVGIKSNHDSGDGAGNGDPAGAAVLANIECVVEDTKMVSKYGMWVLRVVKAWVHPDKDTRDNGRTFHHKGDGTFVIDGEGLDLQERMTKWQEFQD